MCLTSLIYTLFGIKCCSPVTFTCNNINWHAASSCNINSIIQSITSAYVFKEMVSITLHMGMKTAETNDQEHSLTLPIRHVCCHSNETRAPIANPSNSAPPTIPQSYIWVRAVVYKCGAGQTDRQKHTDGRDQYTFCLAIPNAECNQPYSEYKGIR